MVSDKLTVFAIMIIRKMGHSEFVDSIYMNKDSALAYAQKLQNELDNDQITVSVEPFVVNEGPNKSKSNKSKEA